MLKPFDIFMKKLLKQLLPPVVISLARQLWGPRRFKPRWVTISYPPLRGTKLFFDPSGPWQQKMISNQYDRWLFDRLDSLNLKNKIIFDIGAHIGFHSLYFSRLVGPQGKVVAFEPNQKNLERFQLILKQNPDAANIDIQPVALSDQIGTIEFTVNEDLESGRSTGGFIGTAQTFAPRLSYQIKGFKAATVPTTTLDQFAEKSRIAPDLIKIDVEGAEAQVLAGGNSLLLNKKPILFIEIHSMAAMYNVLKRLESLSYQSEIVHEEQNGQCFLLAQTYLS